MKSEISRIVLGTDWMVAVPNLAPWNFAPTKRADAILNGAVELGINAFDTARMYWSEGVIGRFVRKHPLGRDAFWIISKGGQPSVLGRTLARKRILRQVENSLRALGTDYIDVYLLHYDDPRVSAREIADWGIEMLRSGKVRNVGYSNVSLGRIKELRECLRGAKVVPWVSNEFNAVPGEDGPRWKGAQNISRDQAYVGYLRENDIPFLAYSSLGRGGLKKCMESGTGEGNPGDERRRSRLVSLSEKYGVPVSVILLNYILQTGRNFHAIVATSKVEHLKENARAMTLEVSEKDWESLGLA